VKNRSTEFYDRFSDKYDLMISDKRYETELPFFNAVFQKHKVKSILDCACGTGKHVIKFLQLGFEATGSDVSSEMLEKAKRNARSLAMNVNFVQVDFSARANRFGREAKSLTRLYNSHQCNRVV